MDDAASDATRDLVTRADPYRALPIQAANIVGAVIALLRLIPASRRTAWMAGGPHLREPILRGVPHRIAVRERRGEAQPVHG